MPEMTVQEALNLAARHSAAGELAEAEAIYRQVLAIHPNSAPVLHLLGVVRARSRDYAQAHSLIARAIELDPLYVDVAIRRWQSYTGEPATMAITGETFAEIEQRRSDPLQ